MTDGRGESPRSMKGDAEVTFNRGICMVVRSLFKSRFNGSQRTVTVRASIKE